MARGDELNYAARVAVGKVRVHLERALYTIRVNRVRRLRQQAYAGEIPMDVYVVEYLEFWKRYQRRV